MTMLSLMLAVNYLVLCLGAKCKNQYRVESVHMIYSQLTTRRLEASTYLKFKSKHTTMSKIINKSCDYVV